MARRPNMRGLGAQLEEMERTNPKVGKTARAYDDMVGKLTGRIRERQAGAADITPAEIAEKLRTGEATIIMCSRGPRVLCAECSSNAVAKCQRELGGAKAGQTCDRPVCEGHGIAQPDGKPFCRPHHEHALRKAAT